MLFPKFQNRCKIPNSQTNTNYKILCHYQEFFIFLVVSEPVSDEFDTRKSLGTDIGKIWYREKSLGTWIENIWYRKKSRNRYQEFLRSLVVSEPVSEKIGTGKNCQNNISLILF